MNTDNLNFFQRFFFYINEEGYGVVFFDKLAPANDIRRLLCFLITVGLAVFCYFYFRNRKELCKKFTRVLAFILLISRIIRQSVDAIIGLDLPRWRALPIELCTLLSFLIPLAIIFNWENIKPGLYPLAFLGSVANMLASEYFEDIFLPYGSIESVFAHSALFLFPVLELASGNYKIEMKNAWKAFVFMYLFAVWAFFVNTYLLYKHNIETNYMQLAIDALGLGLGGYWHLLTYSIAFAIYIFVYHGGAELYRKLKAKRLSENAIS